MEILKLTNVCKKYPTFALKNVSFSLESGKIMGFIGRNGAGKTTTLKSMMNLIHIDDGEVAMFGKDFFANINECKQDIGFVMNGMDFFSSKKIKDITKSYRKFYKTWDHEKYLKYLGFFKIDENKKPRELSQGMKIKYLLALALSHDAKLLILDEPTSGLDPISREELLEIFLNIVKKEERAILFSTHITSDLDKVADDITYIRDGEIIFSEAKDAIINRYITIEGKITDFTKEMKENFISFKELKDEIKGLALKNHQDAFEKEGIKVVDSNLDDIIVFLEKEASGNEEFTL